MLEALEGLYDVQLEGTVSAETVRIFRSGLQTRVNSVPKLYTVFIGISQIPISSGQKQSFVFCSRLRFCSLLIFLWNFATSKENLLRIVFSTFFRHIFCIHLSFSLSSCRTQCQRIFFLRWFKFCLVSSLVIFYSSQIINLIWVSQIPI